MFLVLLTSACTDSTKLMIDTSKSVQCFKNLQLSMRGAERQAPSILSLALFFSSVMKTLAETGKHGASMTTEQRLASVIQQFHATDGMISRWHVDEDKHRAVLNLLVGTSVAARQLIQGHLNYNKWKESCLTGELLRGTRWLLNACLKGAQGSWKSMLTVTATIQENFLRKQFHHFGQATRKVKVTARAKLRPSTQEWDSLVNYACIMEALKQEVILFYKLTGDEVARDKALQAVDDSFMPRLGSKISLKLWSGTIWPRSRRAWRAIFSRGALVI